LSSKEQPLARACKYDSSGAVQVGLIKVSQNIDPVSHCQSSTRRSQQHICHELFNQIRSRRRRCRVDQLCLGSSSSQGLRSAPEWNHRLLKVCHPQSDRSPILMHSAPDSRPRTQGHGMGMSLLMFCLWVHWYQCSLAETMF
jgi:nucleotidyltransferase/DNA polymerase involved in DNA repair